MSSVLVVDDHDGMRNTLIDILEDVGFDVESACCGDEAIDRFKHQPFGAVVMDVMMPGINGVEAFQQMKSYKEDTKAIFMSAFALDELKEQALNNGAVAFLYKPIDPTQLIDLLEQLMPKAG